MAYMCIRKKIVLHHFYAGCTKDMKVPDGRSFSRIHFCFLMCKRKGRRGLNYECVCEFKTIFFALFCFMHLYAYRTVFILPLGITNDFFGKFQGVYMTRINVKRPPLYT